MIDGGHSLSPRDRTDGQLSRIPVGVQRKRDAGRGARMITAVGPASMGRDRGGTAMPRSR